MSRQCLLGTLPSQHSPHSSAALTWVPLLTRFPGFLSLKLSQGDWHDRTYKKQVSEFMRLSGFHCLQSFRVEKIPVVLPEAVTELTDIPDMIWLQTGLH